MQSQEGCWSVFTATGIVPTKVTVADERRSAPGIMGAVMRYLESVRTAPIAMFPGLYPDGRNAV